MLNAKGDVWVGRAILALKEANPKWIDGFRGAFSNFACSADSIIEAVGKLYREFEESHFTLIGLESILPVQMLDHPLTDYEKELIEATKRYPVQFKNVHLHKGDA